MELDIGKKEEELPPFIYLSDSPMRVKWDLIIVFYVVYYLFSVPVRIAFVSGSDIVAEVIDTSATIVFFADMALNFRTAIRKNGILITDQKEIAKDYIKFWFWIDLAASMPIDSMFILPSATGQLNKLLRLVRIFKLLRLFRAQRILKRFEEATKFNPAMIRLVKLSFVMIIFWHFTA